MITPKVYTEPVKEAISLAELKEQCRIVGSDEDTTLVVYQKGARQYYEWLTGRTIHETVYDYVLDFWPASDHIELPRATPLISIVSVTYLNSAGSPTTWTSSNYIADTYSTPGRLVLAYSQSWPSFTAYPVAPIRIRYKAGIATASPATEAREDDKNTILSLAGAMYQFRESMTMEQVLMLPQFRWLLKSREAVPVL